MPEENKKQPEALLNLHRDLAARIRRDGPLTVAEYMQAAAEAYYSTQNPFGAEGDFTTAPEISQMFGEMIGAWLVDVWMQMGRPDSVKLVELGPGRGTLAADIMRTISTWPAFRDVVTLHLVETSPRLREIQAATLKGFRAGWYDTFSQVPDGVCFVIANEFFDALPIHQFQKTAQGWQERGVDYDAATDAFVFASLPSREIPERLIPESVMPAPEGSIFEANPVAQGVAREVAARISRHGGAALFVDYGHMAPAVGDTLQAVSKHRHADVLEAPGLHDVTAHVDFDALKAVAAPAVTVSGPVTQGQFLIALGIEERAERLCADADPAQRAAVISSLCRLVARQEMGRLFKVMALTPKDAMIAPAGFGLPGVGDDETSDN